MFYLFLKRVSIMRLVDTNDRNDYQQNKDFTLEDDDNLEHWVHEL